MKRIILFLAILFGVFIFSNAQDTIVLSENVLLIKDCYSYIIEYYPTEILYDTIDDNNDLYVRAKFADMSHVEYTEEEGLPELPVYSVSLQVPEECCYVEVATESIESIPSVISGGGGSAVLPPDIATNDPEEDYNSCLPLPGNTIYYPTQACSGDVYCPVYMDQDFYQYYDTSWMAINYYYDTVPVPFFPFQSVTFNILPVHYNPEDNCLRQLPPTRFIITPACDDDLCYMQTATMTNPVWGQDAATFFDNYTPDDYDEEEAVMDIGDYPDPNNNTYQTLNTSYKGDYLIIVQDSYANGIETFKAHKIYYGYHVEVLTLSQVAAEAALITNFSHWPIDIAIRIVLNYRKTNNEYLKYVLLVSEEGVIPPSAGVTFNNVDDNDKTNPPSDILYSSFNNIVPYDLYLLPELYIGRWIINNSLELSNIIQKTIDTETSFYSKHIALFSGTLEGKESFFNTNTEIAQKIVAVSSITVTNIDGRLYPNYTSIMNTTLQDGVKWMWIYNGHGNIDYIESPYREDADDIINDNIFCPFGFGTGCLQNTYHSWGLGSRLLTQSYLYGTTTYYGASTESYRYSSNKLMKSIFYNMLKNTNISIGQMVEQGERKYYDACRTSVFKQRTIKQYNLFGDPSLPLQGYDDQTGYVRPFLKPKYNSDKEQQVTGTMLYDITGKLLKSSGFDDIDIHSLSNGLYIKVTETNNGTCSKKLNIVNNY